MAFPARPATHVVIRRDSADPGPWWWMCIRDQCIADCRFPLVGSQYPTHPDALAGALEHLTHATTPSIDRSTR